MTEHELKLVRRGFEIGFVAGVEALAAESQSQFELSSMRAMKRSQSAWQASAQRQGLSSDESGPTLDRLPSPGDTL
ncbi:MAG: hypothetical protein AAGJ19_13710 [Myxococcota bacterium]